MENYLNDATKPRGIRNNNPGNLRRLGAKAGVPQLWNGEIPYAQSKDASFSQFSEMKFGVRAMMKDIYGDYNRGLKTVQSLIGNYAPPNENNTIAYIANVAKNLGTAATTVFELTEESMLILCKAIVAVENGASAASYVSDKDYTDGLALAKLGLKKKILSCKCCGQALPSQV